MLYPYFAITYKGRIPVQIVIFRLENDKAYVQDKMDDLWSQNSVLTSQSDQLTLVWTEVKLMSQNSDCACALILIVEKANGILPIAYFH